MNEGITPQKSNGTLVLLSTLAKSGHAWVQGGTLVLIALSGFGNWVATWNSADRNKAEIEVSRRVAWESEQRVKQELVTQVAEIHGWLKEAATEFHQGNIDSAWTRKTLAGITDELKDFEDRQKQELDGIKQVLRGRNEYFQRKP